MLGCLIGLEADRCCLSDCVALLLRYQNEIRLASPVSARASGFCPVILPSASCVVRVQRALQEAGCARIIGILLETRPDQISKHSLQKLRWLGCTRVQLGIQHTDNEILKLNNRGCAVFTTNSHAVL